MDPIRSPGSPTWFSRSLRSRLLLLVLVAHAPALALILDSAARDRTAALREERRDAERWVRMAVLDHQRMIEGTRQLLAALAGLPEVLERRDEDCERLFRQLLSSNPVYSNLGVADESGRVWCSAAPLPSRDAVRIDDRAYFREAIATGTFVIGSYQLGRITGRPGISFGYPAGAGDRRGVVFASLDLDWLDHMARELEIPEDAVLMVVDPTGRIVARYPDPEGLTGEDRRDSPIVTAILGQAEGTAESVGLDGVERIYAWAPLLASPDAGAWVAIGFPREQALARANETRLRNLVLLALVAILAVAAAWFGSDLFVLRRLREVTRSAERLSDGQLGERAPVEGADEIAITAGALNRMADRLGAMISIEQGAKAALEAEVDRLVEARTREITLLNQTGELLQACESIEEASRVIATMVPRLFPGDAGAVFLTSSSRNVLEALATWGGPETRPGEEVFAPSDCWALRLGRPHLVEDAASGLVCRHRSDVTSGTTLCLPMVAHGETLGVFHLGAPPRPDPLGSHETRMRLATSIAEPFAMSLANLRLRASLRNQSIVDPLTGLFNRRFLEETLERELRRAERHGHPLGLLVLDLDHFKRFNDTFGHDAGDAVLRALGQFLKSQVRGSDVVCRFGGEEFVLTLPDTSFEDVQRRAQEILVEARSLSLTHLGVSLGSITLSIGLAMFPDHGTRRDELLKAADEALYRSKAAGRDRVTVAGG